MSNPAPGWYPDGEVAAGERWWDGQTWTDHRRRSQQQAATGPAAGWYDDKDRPSTQRWWDGQRWTDHRQQHPASTSSAGGGGSDSSIWKIALGVLAGILAAMVIVFFLTMRAGSGTFTELDPSGGYTSADLQDDITASLKEQGTNAATLECDEPGEAQEPGDRTFCRGEARNGTPLSITVTFQSDGGYTWETN